MSNTATASMVVPIAMAVLDELYPKPELSGKRRRASMFKERSEVDFELLVAKAKAQRNRLARLQKANNETMTDSTTVHMNPAPAEECREETKFLTNLDFLNE